MSNSNQAKQDTEGIHLSEHMKEDISVEELIDYSSTRRIASIDFVKGLAMAFIILAHSALAWFDDDWRYIYGLVFSFLDILGPSLFVFLSALSVIFSIKRKKKKVSEKLIRNRIITRGIVIVIIGILFNPMSLFTSGEKISFPLNLWGWNFLVFIGFSQIFSYYVLKIKQIPRAAIGVFIIIISPFIRQVIFEIKDVNPGFWLLHFLITSPLPQVPFLPWLAVCFISTIFGEFLYDAMIKGTKEAYIHLFRVFSAYGIVLVLTGLILGWGRQTPATMKVSEYLHLDLLRIANEQDYYQFAGMPDFMIRSTMSNMFYNLGAALLIIAVSFYFIDIKRKENDVIKMVIFYGKTSLSLFLIQYLFLPLYIGQFSIIFFPLMWIGYCGFLGLLMYVWYKYFNGVGSPEWLMTKLGQLGQKPK
ncbi:MAG: heparan-alpha-glucosaminide N-acetyltransferase domain-containing protein [Candidatus Hodarchaeota archaeon]